MAAAKATLYSIRSQVMQFRPGISPSLVERFINARIRHVIGKRTYWTDLVKRGVLAVPDAWTEGTVSVTPGGSQVIGTGTNWPVYDPDPTKAVNTILRDGIFETGNQEVFPASMQGITEQSVLYVDAAGVPEIVAVNDVTPNSFWAVFSQSHNQNCTVTQSPLVGRQFRMGYESPIFDVLAVIDPQTLVIDQPWGGVASSDQKYQIAGMYYTVTSNIRQWEAVVDRQQGFPLLTNVALRNVNAQDPQRTASGDPIALVDIGASRNGLVLYELWPTQLSARQIDWCVYTDWPELRNDTDRAPWFIDPEVWFDGAVADALRYRAGKDDYLHNPALARDYEAKYADLVQAAMNADESKMQKDYSSPNPLGLGGGPGTLFFQTHTGWSGDWTSDI